MADVTIQEEIGRLERLVVAVRKKQNNAEIKLLDLHGKYLQSERIMNEFLLPRDTKIRQQEREKIATSMEKDIGIREKLFGRNTGILMLEAIISDIRSGEIHTKSIFE